MPKYTPQTAFRSWIDAHGHFQAWVAAKLGYNPQYLSRVLNGTNPLTDEFRQRCADRLQVPDHVWRNNGP